VGLQVLRAMGKNIRILLIIFWVAVGLCAAQAYPQSPCLMCHGDKTFTTTDSLGQTESLYVDSAQLAQSVHGGFGCQDCHSGITSIPHAENLPRVDCGGCHSDIAKVYKRHGYYEETPGNLMPDCHDCHGTHDILAPSDKESKVNPVNLPRTCGHCHEDSSIVGKYHIPMISPVEAFETSVHSRLVDDSSRLAATCIDCHSIEGTAHMIWAPIFPQSSIYHFNIPETCGRCHKEIQTRYEQGVHGQAAAKGENDAPVCTDCHSDHQILPVSDPRSRVSSTKASMTTCAPCHESRMLNVKYGLPAGVMESWRHSYHGLKSTDGDPRVANCSSCHRAHLILPRTDSLSSVAPANVKKTCAKCHPSITVELAEIPIHKTRGIFLNVTARTFRSIYIVAIIIIIGAMVVHWIIDLTKRIRMLNHGKQVVRMQRDELWQHTLLMVTFTVLAVTGFAFHHSGAWWAKALFGWPDGFLVRRIIHRVAAGLFVLTALWHVFYLRQSRGRQFMRDMFPRPKDFVQFFHTMAYDLGLRKEPPRFGRFSYIEKAEYWALVWGTAVMTLTGFFLWFGHITEDIFHVGALGVMLVVHYYEAILASLAILIWHFYSTIFNPPIYPNNPSWYTGKMPIQMYRDEHPDDPVLKKIDSPEPPEPLGPPAEEEME
jgi:cytochrome b subunit of formate dehydrogenase